MEKLKVIIKEIPVSLIDENIGQIPGVPENPRRITDEAFELLKKSITESPEMKTLDEIKVFPLGDRYVAIVMRGTHMCKSMRGVKNQGMMTVAHLSGVFKEDEKARREFYKLIDMQ